MMISWKEHRILILGMIILLLSIVLLAYANSRLAVCESLSGKVVQFLDSAKRDSCANIRTALIISYAGLALGVLLTTTFFVLNKKR